MKSFKRNDTGSQRTFMSGVLILSFSTIAVKIIGLAYKIPLMSALGVDGMGYFNTAYEIFALLCGISTSGLPVAVSMLVSAAVARKDEAGVQGVFRLSSALLLTKGVLISGALALLAEPVSVWIGNPQAYLAILAISPALLFCCVAGAVRGYFQGLRIMTPTAVSQLSEAMGKLVFGVALALIARRFGGDVPLCAAFAVLGVSLGSLASAGYLLVKKRRMTKAFPKERATREEIGVSVMSLLKISLPITLCSALIGVTRFIDMTLIMRRLQDVGVSAAQANRIYGAYTTLALPVFGLVPAFIPPITESLIPRLAAAVESNSEDEQSRAVWNALRLTVFLGIPASIGVSIYAEQIISLLFSGADEAISIATPLLSALGASVAVSCMITTTNAVLQSYRKIFLPILSLLAGAVVKAVSAYVLIGIPSVGAMGAPISAFISNLTVLALNLCFVWRVCPKGTRIFKGMPKIALCSSLSIGLSYLTYVSLFEKLGIGMKLSFAVAFLMAVGTYFVLTAAFGVIGKEDIAVIGKNKKCSINKYG